MHENTMPTPLGEDCHTRGKSKHGDIWRKKPSQSPPKLKPCGVQQKNANLVWGLIYFGLYGQGCYLFLPVVCANFSFRAFHYFAFFKLSTRSVGRTLDENDRPSQQTKHFSRYHSMR